MTHRAGAARGFWLGATLGAKTGLVLASLYALPFVLLFVLTPPFMLNVGMLAVEVGIAPGTLLGLVFGALVGALLQWQPASITPATAGRMGMGLGCVAAVGLNVAYFALGELNGGTSTWLMFMVLPSLIFIAAAGWMAAQLARHLAEPDYRVTMPGGLHWLLIDEIMLGMSFIFLLSGIATAMLESHVKPNMLVTMLLVSPFVAGLVLVVLYVRQHTQISSQS